MKSLDLSEIKLEINFLGDVQNTAVRILRLVIMGGKSHVSPVYKKLRLFATHFKT